MTIEALERDDMLILSAGTDGVDGPTTAAGAVLTGNDVSVARTRDLNPEQALDDNDVFPLLERLGALIHTGPTHTNVMDVQLVMLVGPH